MMLDARDWMLDAGKDYAKPKFIKKAADLDVFKVAFQSSMRVCIMANKLPKHEQYDLGSQIRRSSRSVCANIEEGFMKQAYYKKDFAKYLVNALASAGETQLWLKYCIELDYIDNATFNELNNDYEKTCKMLRSFIDKLGVL